MIAQHYTTQQVAEKLNVSVDTVKRYIKKYKLTAVKLENEFRIPEPAIAAWIESRTIHAKKLKKYN